MATQSQRIVVGHARCGVVGTLDVSTIEAGFDPTGRLLIGPCLSIGAMQTLMWMSDFFDDLQGPGPRQLTFRSGQVLEVDWLAEFANPVGRKDRIVAALRAKLGNTA